MKWQPKKAFLLGDGAVSEDIWVRGKDVLGGNTIIAFQLPDVVPENLRSMYKDNKIKGLSFAPYGFDSFFIFAEIMQTIHSHNDTVNRQSIAAELKTYHGSKKSIEGDLGNYRFDEYGNNTESDYSFYIPDFGTPDLVKKASMIQSDKVKAHSNQ